jgi:hypothetical protein
MSQEHGKEGPTPADTDFDLKQHDFLRSEIQTAEGEARANERHSILALAALWAWAAKEAPSAGVVIGVISAMIGILGGLRAWALWINMATKADYVAQIEVVKARPHLGGWEHYFRDTTKGKETIPSQNNVQKESARPWSRRPGAIGYTSAAFWVIIALTSVPFGFLLRGLKADPGPAPAKVQVQCVSSTEPLKSESKQPPGRGHR